MFNEYTYFNGVQENVPDMLKLIDKWCGPNTYPHMAAVWAVALNSPFGWMKQVPSDFGGTRNGMVVSWPKGIKAKNKIRTQFGHVIDIAPTVLAASALPEPTTVNGVKQIPMAGASLVYSFDNDPRQSAELSNISRSPEIARFIMRVGSHARPTRRLGRQSPVAHCRTIQLGNCSMYDPTSVWSMTCPQGTPKSSRSFRRSVSRQPKSTASFPSTTGSLNGSTPQLSGVPTPWPVAHL